MQEITPELIVGVAGFAITFGTMLYKFGRLEGMILERLKGHDEAIRELKTRCPLLHGRV